VETGRKVAGKSSTGTAQRKKGRKFPIKKPSQAAQTCIKNSKNGRDRTFISDKPRQKRTRESALFPEKPEDNPY